MIRTNVLNSKGRRYAVTAMVAAIGATVLWAADAPGQLGITDKVARQYFEDTVDHGYLAYTTAMAKAFKAMPGPARTALVNDAVGWAKAYVASPAYKTSYAQKRDAEKPAAPEIASVDDEIKKQQAEQQKQLEDMKKTVALMPADQRAQMEAIVKQAAAQMDQMAKDPKMIAMTRQSFEARHADEQKRYQDSLKTWQNDYPADPSVLLARRLKAFLDTSATVDFNAKVATRGTQTLFVDTIYEQKPSEWKFCYRAGREAVTAARAAATAWLAELPK